MREMKEHIAILDIFVIAVGFILAQLDAKGQ